MASLDGNGDNIHQVSNNNIDADNSTRLPRNHDEMFPENPWHDNDDHDPSFSVLDTRVAMPYDHPGIDCSTDRVRISLTELQQYIRGEIFLDDRYVDQKKRERDSNTSNPAEEEDVMLWNRLRDQRRLQRELLESGVRVVLNERGQLIPAEDITADGGAGGRNEPNNIIHNNNNIPRAHPVLPPVMLLPFLGGVAANHNNIHNNNGMDQLIEVEEERILREQQRETEAILARHAQQLRTTLTEFEVVRIPEGTRNAALPANNLTFRRICIAVLAVAASFVCIMIQSLPPPYSGDDKEVSGSNAMETDHLMYDLFDIRDWPTHVKYCGYQNGYFSKEKVKIQTTQVLKFFTKDSFYDCSYGVLHIPSKNRFLSKRRQTAIKAMWKLDCDFPTNITVPHHTLAAMASNKASLGLEHESSAALSSCNAIQEKDPIEHCNHKVSNNPQQRQQQQQCFRGIHDNILLPEEVDTLIQLASTLIQKGGDHVTIRTDVHDVLTSSVPVVMNKLQRLIQSHYTVDTDEERNIYEPMELTPVAFRFHVAISPVPHAAHETGSANPMLDQLINQTVMQKWIQPIYQKHIKTSLISLLFPPFSMKTSVLLTSDPCLLSSDLELKAEYKVQTTIFLVDKGSTEDYTGGSAFFIQEKEWNVHRRWRRRYKLQRGLAVDGSKGRIIVSTGGNENLHCYLPLKGGIRAALQIWWNVR